MKNITNTILKTMNTQYIIINDKLHKEPTKIYTEDIHNIYWENENKLHIITKDMKNHTYKQPNITIDLTTKTTENYNRKKQQCNNCQYTDYEQTPNTKKIKYKCTQQNKINHNTPCKNYKHYQGTLIKQQWLNNQTNQLHTEIIQELKNINNLKAFNENHEDNITTTKYYQINKKNTITLNYDTLIQKIENTLT